jgi:3-hydroxymyristoyl/3-hydroxydecanoyl-(acyl carrier protein) dehydratase
MPIEAARATFAEVTIVDGVARAVVRRAHAEALCEGHFPGEPFVPGAYLAGLMAEAGRQLLLAGEGEARLAEVEDCLFHEPVVPGDGIVVEARVLDSGPEGWRVAAEVRTDGVRAARGRLRFAATE